MQRKKQRRRIQIKQFRKWRLGSINISTASEDWRLEDAIKLIDKSGCLVCALSEVRRLGVGSVLIDGINHEYEFYWSGFKRKREYGVGIAIRKIPGIEVGEIVCINERLMTAELNIFGLSVKIVSGYAPTNEAKDHAKVKFYRDLKKIKRDNPDQKMLYLGDFNATTSAVENFSGVRADKILENIVSNDNGERMIDFVRDNKLSLLNTFFKQPRHRQITWHSRDKWKTKKTLDYHISDDYLRQYCQNCRVYNGFKFQSDHRLLISSWRTPMTKRARFIKRKKGESSIKFDLSGLRDGTLKTKFKKLVDELSIPISGADGSDIPKNLENMCENIVETLNTAAAQTLPPKAKTVNPKPVWSTDTIFLELLAERDKLGSKCTRNISKKIRKRSKFLKNEHFKEQARELEILNQQGRYRAVFEKAKSQVSTFQKIRVKLEPDKGFKFFSNHFNPTPPTDAQTPPELLQPPEFVEILQKITKKCNIDSSPPTKIEVADTLKRLKTNKSSCDVPPEFLKYAAEVPGFVDLFHEMTCEIWGTKSVPKSFGHGRLEALFKNKGSNKEAKNYRGLNIGSCVAKAVISIILERLKFWYNSQLSYHQCGFRPGMGTTDAIYILKRAMQVSVRKNSPLFLIFCDLSAAFDHCVRKWLFQSIRMRFGPDADTTLVDILEHLYANTSCEMDGDILFDTTSGVRQGGPESPWLYTLFADFVMRCFLLRCRQRPEIKFYKHKFKIPSFDIPSEFENSPLFELFLEWLGYADDTVLMLIDAEGLQAAYDLYEKTLTDFFLKVNPSKTKTQICNFQKSSIFTPKTSTTPESAYPDTLISAVKGTELEPIENIEKFCYVGALTDRSEPGTGWTEINNRMESAKVQFAINKNLFCNYNLALSQRVHFYNSLIRSRLTYGCQNWALTAAMYDKLDTCQRIMLRKIVGGGFRKRQNLDPDDHSIKYYYLTPDILEITKTEDVSKFIKRQQRNYTAHLIRTANTKPTKQLMFNNDKYTKPGRHAPELLQQAVKQSGLSQVEFLNEAVNRKF